MDEKLAAYVKAPLADPLNFYLPEGKRRAVRGPRYRHVDEIGAPKLTAKEARERKENAFHDKVAALLDYYGTTTVPCERIAEHLRLDLDLVRTAMRNRGRDV